MGMFTKALTAAAAIGASLALVAPASAATIITPVQTGPFSLGNPTGTVPAFKVFAGNDYYFTFTTLQKLDVLTQLQASTTKGAPQNVQFSLYSGVPTGGSLLGTSNLEHGPALDLILDAGSYYLKLDVLAVSGELLSGGLTVSAIPEPAVWSMMFLGVAGIGATLRSNRRRQAMVAA